MSHWNKAYLDALEVPVWVPLHDHTSTKDDNPTSEKSEDTAKVEAEVAYKFKRLHGEESARIAFLIPKEMDLKTALITFQQLQFAWKAWLEQPLSAALFQEVEANENDSSGLLDIESFGGQVIDCSQGEQELDLPTLAGPAFNFKEADKKAWWQLLQRLH
ncbi:hypothetical protein [Kangiella sediminilitoris]|uniref:Uncharacterized protein n=1 Tax=Kangiella sediminilitoris TaxID=1144748 RepID=A0A1B3B9D3_9GAMM|nr:hypothetical protein [Kangiella sediminilitoris]AOE49407.1 hypothetical protein KS2013_683 [Kangiella sediminilitoris]